jgi:ribonuclease BN (tRNA processing enzyme)
MARAYDLPSNPGMEAEFDFLTLDDGQPLRIGPFDITPHRVVHPVEAYAFRVVGPGENGSPRTLTYTGDTDSCGGVELAAADADLLLAEAAFEEGRDTERGIHLTGRRAGELATTAGARRLVLTHLPPWNDAATALRDARGAFAGDVELARPGAVHLL